MAEALDLSYYTRVRDNGAAELELAVEGVTCGACIASIESAMKHLPGVVDARLDFTNRRLRVAWSDGASQPAEVLRRTRPARLSRASVPAV